MRRVFALAAAAAAVGTAAAQAQGAPEAACKPVYLVFDSGDMQSARIVSLVLQRAKVPATFFVGDSPTPAGGTVISRQWADWWKARAAEGHELAVLPRYFPLWRGDLPGREPQWRIRMQAGGLAGREFTWNARKYCEQIDAVAERLEFYAGKKPLPLFHASQNQASPSLLQAARQCGYTHVQWPAAYVAGDSVAGDALLKRAFAQTRAGDILLSHMSAWPGQNEAAPAALTPLIEGLKERGFCFKTLREHPDYATR